MSYLLSTLHNNAGQDALPILAFLGRLVAFLLGSHARGNLHVIDLRHQSDQSGSLVRNDNA